MSAIPTPLAQKKSPTAPNYAAYGVTPPTPEQQVKLAEQAIRLDVEQYGVWPNPAKEPNKLENWRGRMTHRMNAYLKAFDIHKSEWSSMVSGYKTTMEAEKRYEWSYAKELADKEIGIRVRNKGKTVADDIPGGDMTKKQASHHSATAEQVAEAKEAFAKALAVPPVSPEVQAKADKLSAALVRIDSEMSYRDVDLSLRRNVFRRYGGATCEKVVTHPDYNQLTVEGEYRAEVTRVRNPIPLIDDDQLSKDIAATPPDDKLDDWFPRGNDAAKPSDEADDVDGDPYPDDRGAATTLPTHWSKDDKQRTTFFVEMKDAFGSFRESAMLKPEERLAFIHEALGVEHLHQTKLDRRRAYEMVSAKVCQRFSEATSQNAPISNQEATTLNETKPTEVIPPENVEAPKNAPLQTEGKIHHMEAPVIAYTTIIINDHRVNVTAREGATAEQVHDTVLALVNGLRLIAADETIKSYAAVIDGRDKTIPFKGQPKAAEPAPALPSVPTPSNGNGTASGGSDSGTVACMMIEVGTTYTGGKPALKFSCDGYEIPLQFAKQPGEMVKLLSKVKQATGVPFTAEDLTNGRKFGGAWKVAWRDAIGKDEKMHRNVIDVLPA